MMALKGWRLGLALLLGLGLGTATAIVAYRALWAPGEAKRAAVQAKAEVGGAKVQAENAKDAVALGDRVIERNNRIERITRENTVRIMAAPGASVAADPGLADAWVSALCLRDAYRGASACRGLSEPLALVNDDGHAAGANP